MLCFKGGQSWFHVPHNHADRFTRGKLQAWGRRQADLAVFAKTQPPLPVLQRDGVNAAEKGEEKKLMTVTGADILITLFSIKSSWCCFSISIVPPFLNSRPLCFSLIGLPAAISPEITSKILFLSKAAHSVSTSSCNTWILNPVRYEHWDLWVLTLCQEKKKSTLRTEFKEKSRWITLYFVIKMFKRQI